MSVRPWPAPGFPHHADAAGFAPAAAQDLGFENPWQRKGRIWFVFGPEKLALWDWDAGFLKELLAVVLIELHESILASTVVKHHALDYHRARARMRLISEVAGRGFAILSGCIPALC